MKTLVILGAGLLGLPLTHYALQNIYPKTKNLKVILVTPNADHYWNLASVRAIVPGQLPDEKMFVPIKPALERYPKESYELVLGMASSLEPEANEVLVRTNDGADRRIKYDALIIATGTSAKDGMPWKNLESTERTKQALHAVREELGQADTIAIAGGGITGSETVGEVAFEYGQKQGKKVYWVIADDLPLTSAFREDVRRGIISEVEKIGAKLIKNTKVTGVTSTGGKKKTLELTKKDGRTETLEVDAYIPTIGTVPNTDFVPEALRDASGYVKQGEDLRVPGYNNLYVVGDAGNLEASTVINGNKQGTHMTKILEHVLGKGGAPADAPKYAPNGKVGAGITLGRSRGTGQMGSMKLFSLMIWWLKGRHLGTNYNRSLVEGNKVF